MKKTILTVLAAAAAMLMTFSAFAGVWRSDAVGWWYDNGDGTWPVYQWMWIDGNNDGMAECYYFDENGYCLLNTTAPDGSQLDANGAWTVGGVVQSMPLNQFMYVEPATGYSDPTERYGGNAVLYGNGGGFTEYADYYEFENVTVFAGAPDGEHDPECYDTTIRVRKSARVYYYGTGEISISDYLLKGGVRMFDISTDVAGYVIYFYDGDAG